MAKKEKAGYRQRLRKRFLAGEAGSCSDETLLELLLTFAIGRKDVSSLAHELIRVFGSLPQVLSASPDDLYKVKGVGQSSVALLKAVNFIRSSDVSAETRKPIPKGAGAVQQEFFENSLDGQPKPDSESSKPNSFKISYRGAKKEVFPPFNRKLQISRSHVLEFKHFSRLLNFLYENREKKNISRGSLVENLGLPDGQIASLLSIGNAMGLIQSKTRTLSPEGILIAEHDIFLEKHGTLEWCHYKGAGNYRNLIWFEVFNHLLGKEDPMTQEEWHNFFRNQFQGVYSLKTIKDQVPKEVRFIIDAYIRGNFSKLELLDQSSDLSAGQAGERLYRRRYTDFAPLVLSAMIYDFCASRESHLSQVGEMAVTPGSPAMVFGLDAASFRQQIEGLHDRGWLRYETTHNLDQIRLKPGFSALEFLTAYFEGREPREASNQSPGGIFE